jgi:hypothetical protein
VRALAAHDHAGAVGPARRLQGVGDLGHPRALPGPAILADRRPPRRFGQREDRLADRLGEVEAHHEADARGAQLVAEFVRGAGAVGAHHDLRLFDDRPRQLLEREVDNLDVIGGGVGAGVARAQHTGQRLAGSRRGSPAAGESQSHP